MMEDRRLALKQELHTFLTGCGLERYYGKLTQGGWSVRDLRSMKGDEAFLKAEMAANCDMGAGDVLALVAAIRGEHAGGASSSGGASSLGGASASGGGGVVVPPESGVKRQRLSLAEGRAVFETSREMRRGRVGI